LARGVKKCRRQHGYLFCEKQEASKKSHPRRAKKPTLLPSFAKTESTNNDDDEEDDDDNNNQKCLRLIEEEKHVLCLTGVYCFCGQLTPNWLTS